MAAKEMADYLSAVTADYTTAELSIEPQEVLPETYDKNQSIIMADDGSEQILRHSDNAIIDVIARFHNLDESDAGDIVDMYNLNTKACARARSFYWAFGDGHTYTVKFRGPLTRGRLPALRHQIDSIPLKIIGTKP